MKEIEKLKQEIEQLKRENSALKSQLSSAPPKEFFNTPEKILELFDNIYFKSANQGIWDINLEDDQVIFNDKLAEILEITDKNRVISSKQLDSFIHEDDLPIVLASRQNHIEQKSKFFEVDYRIRTQQNNVKWVNSRGKIISYVNKKQPKHIVGFTIDITDTKVSVEKLRTEEEKYKSFFLNSPLGAFKSTADGNLLEINKEFARLFGYKNIPEALKSIKDIANSLYANPDERKKIVRAIQKKPGIHIYEVEFKKKNGSYFMGRLIAKKVIDVDGNTILEGHLEDISESKRILNILLKSEEKFNQLANTITDVFWIIDNNKKLLFINQAFEQVFGRKIETLLENPNDRINWIHPEDRQRLQNIFDKGLYKKGPINEYYRIIKPDSEVRWIWGRNFPIVDEHNELYRVVGVMTDVTEQKLLENALLQSNKKISLLLEQTPLGYIEWNRSFEITNWNNAAAQIFNYSAEEAIGNSIIDLIVPSYNKDYFIHLFNDLIDQKGSTKTTNENIDKDGNIVICDWYNNALVDNNGEIIGLASIVQDITARVNAEREVVYSQNFFNTTFNAIPDYIHVIDKEHKIVFVNQSFQQFLQELKLPLAKEGVPLNEVFPFLKSRVFREYRQVFETGEALNTNEFTRIRSLKVYTETRKTPVFEEGTVKYIVTTVRNVTARVQAEQALRDSEKRLQLAFDAANDGLWDFNPKTKEINYFSPRWFTMLGYEADELPHTYETWTNLLHPEERIKVENLVWDFINDKKDTFTIEFRLRNKNGHYQWVLSRGDVVEFDENGFPTRMVGTHVDISENKKILNLLSNKEQQLSTLLENSNDSIVVLDKDGKIKYAGNLEAKIIGEPVTELIGISYYKFVHEDDREIVQDAVRYSFKNKDKRLNVEFRSHLDTGELVFLEAILSNHAKTKGINGVVLNIRNITEKKIDAFKKEELTRNQNLLSETAQNFLQIRNEQEIYAYISKKLIEFIGHPVVFIGKYYDNHVENKYAGGIDKYADQIREIIGEKPEGFTIVLNDQRRKLLLTKKLIELKGGIVDLTLNQLPATLCKKLEEIFALHKIYLIGISHHEDIKGSIVILTNNKEEIQYPNVVETLVYQASIALERISLENKLRISKNEAEKADNLKSAFLANMSHEIRTPMNAILGFADLLNDKELKFEQRQEFIKIINTQGEQLMRLINDIIDISKIESGQINIVMVPVNLNVFLNNLHQLFHNKVRTDSNNKVELKMTTHLPDKSVNVYLDEVRINQVFINLLNNALKYTRNGEIEFGYDIDSSDIKFYVKDTGIGITDEMKEIIFERFRQADNSQVRKYGGTGLGLAICKGILENMQGEIWVEANKSNGATFYFTIPYYPVTDDFIPKKVNYYYKEKYNWEGKKILIVEDDETSLFYLQTILKDTGVEIIFAENGKDAIEIFNKHKNDIDVALIDVQLPEISGLQVCEHIKKTNKKVNVIIQTAYAMPGDEKSCLKSGANDYVTKPVKVAILKPLINYYLNLA